MAVIKYQDDGFSLKCERDITIEKRTPVEDFNTYTFKKKDAVILSAYVGNNPSLKFKNKSSTEMTNGKINNLEYELISINSKGSKKSKEVLFKFPHLGWPQYIHFWYSDLDSESINIAENIIWSTKAENTK